MGTPVTEVGAASGPSRHVSTAPWVSAEPDANTPTGPRAGNRRRWRSQRLVAQLLGCTGVALLWEGGSRLEVWESQYIPPPSAVLTRLPELLQQGPLAADISTSLRTILAGLGISTLVGGLLALVAFAVPAIGWCLAPIVELARGIAPLALLPAFLVIFGIGGPAALAVVVWVTWPPIFISTLAGLKAVDHELVLAARSLGASRRKVVSSVYFMAGSAPFFAGVRIAYGNAWLAVVAAEMLGSNAGLGFRILEWSQTFRLQEMYAAILVIGFLSLGGTAALNWLERHAAPWRADSERV